MTTLGSIVATEQNDNRQVKIRRRGRHTTPSTVERVTAATAAAAPAVAVAGVLVGAPHAAAAETTGSMPAVTQHATGTHLDAATHSAKTTAKAQSSRSYTVAPGDTLSGIAQKFYHNASDWAWLYHVNSSTLTSANMIYPGQKLNVPSDPPAHYSLPSGTTQSTYQPRHASSSSQSQSTGGSDQSSATPSASAGGGAATTTATTPTTTSGTQSCSSLESLWEQAGGAASQAVTAASIAMAESGGNPNAISPTDDYGLWQINASHGSMASLNPLTNARSAVAISNDGTNWGPWTTFTSGIYQGRC